MPKHFVNFLKSNIAFITTIILLIIVISGVKSSGDDILSPTVDDFKKISLKDDYEIVISLNGSEYAVTNETTGILYYRKYQFENLTKSLVKIINLNRSCCWGLIQIHSYQLNLTLSLVSDNSELSPQNHETGTNLGFVFYNKTSQFWIYNFNYPNTVDAVILVTVYDRRVPIPGGCNQENPVEVAPTLTIVDQGSMIQVDIPEAAPYFHALNKSSYCWTRNLTYTTRYQYVQLKVLKNLDWYFDCLDRIFLGKNKYYIAEQHPPGPTLRRLYKSLSNLGVVLTTVVKNEFGEAAYAPRIYIKTDDPKEHADKMRIVSLSILAIMFGVFKINFEHVYQEIRLVCNGIELSIFFIFIVYLVIANFANSNSIPFLLLCAGTAFSITYCHIIAYIKKNYIIVKCLLKSSLSYVLTCYTIYFIGDQSFLISNLDYLIVFLVINILYLGLLSFLGKWSPFVVSTMLGTLYIMIGLNFLFQSNMKYAIYNNYGRIEIKNWNYAYGSVRITWIEYIQIVIWMLILMITIIFNIKKYEQIFTTASPEETQPLITRMASDDLGSDDVFESPQTNYRILRQLSAQRKRMIQQ